MKKFNDGRGQGDVSDQATAAYVEAGREAVEGVIKDLNTEAAKQTGEAMACYAKAQECMQKVRNFIAADNHILGNPLTKHGEIAEHLEAGIANSKQYMQGLEAIANIDVGRTAPEDFVLNGTPIQSKFINGARNCLEHVLGHMEKYPDFPKDAGVYGYPGKSGLYMIPKDTHEKIMGVLEGNPGEFSQKTVNSIKGIVEKIEEASGRTFSDVVRPSRLSYSEVQTAVAGDTISKYEGSLQEENRSQVEKIEENRSERVGEASKDLEFSAGGLLGATAIGGAFGGVLNAGVNVFKKLNDGKSLSDFTLDDWKDAGVDFVKGAARGGAGGAITYTLVQGLDFAAPLAGAVASVSIGIASLAKDCLDGKISKGQFADAALSLGVSTAVTSLGAFLGSAAGTQIGAAIGTAAIPIPVVGSIVGALVGKTVVSIATHFLKKHDSELLKELEERNRNLLEKLGAEEKRIIGEIDAYFNKLDGLINAAFDYNTNSYARKDASILLARECKVPEKDIIHNKKDLRIFLGK